jgi:hypothetical protein
MDGWNGSICREPARNTFCVGPHSYPGDKIKTKRNLKWEADPKVAGHSCAKVNGIPPCIYSINAFGRDALTAYDEPPDFFGSGERTEWNLPPATVCVWPYEAMYDDGAKTDGYVDNDKRLAQANEYFSAIDENKSLIFHYANYSNPFSSDDAKKYVVIGLSRVKNVGRIEFYKGTTEETKKRFGGAYVWQRNIETHYPDQGMRIPYHRYLDKPEVLEKIALFPDNPRCFKYGSRHLTDDDALTLVERLIEIASFLIEIADDSENWQARLDWLNGLLAELWASRGLYPGLANVLLIAGLPSAVPALRNACARGQDKAFYEAVFSYLSGARNDLPGCTSSAAETSKIRRQWSLKPDDERACLRDVLPFYDLPKEQMERIISPDRAANGLDCNLSEITENPYLLSEQFVGDNPDDTISFSRIDHGVYPSPDLGGTFRYDIDDWRRLRALCVERLKFETKHTFMTCGQMLQDVNRRLGYLPEWKRADFTARYLEVDREGLEKAIVFRREDERDYAYLRNVYEDERAIESRVRNFANLPDIQFKSPVTESYWRDLLRDPESPLSEKSDAEYGKAIQRQAQVCAKIFNRPISVICGAAGTGKTTIVKSILTAIEKAHGAQATFLLLAPTGKAADRLRERTGKSASTIHSFLARLGWLNGNLTIKRNGGQREDKVTTYVIDEASMLDLGLTAALLRAVNWHSVQRVILVGDPNQLPPIGRGRAFADIIDWLSGNYPGCVGELTVNLRQMENRVSGRGTGILDLASVFIRNRNRDQKDEEQALHAESMFQRLQDLPAGGEVDKDLRVVFWQGADQLLDKLMRRMISDMEEDTSTKHNVEAPYTLWNVAAKSGGLNPRPEYHQVLSPYRYEDFGSEAINLRIQLEARGQALTRVGQLAGITLFDKVIQVRNRGASDPIWAYDNDARDNKQVNIFNGELGFVAPHGFDGHKWKIPEKTHFHLKRFQVRFSRKESLAVSYGRELGFITTKNGKKRYLPEEKPEDNLELAYAISVHKAQGSEFDRVYFIVPKNKIALLSPELFYTGLTRATRHCTIFIEEDIAPLLHIYRPESSHLVGINCSLFEFTPVPDGFELIRREGYFEEGKIHRSLADVMVRSKSEVIIANMLWDRDIPFTYEKALYAPDGSFYLPDFTINWRGETYYWEHLGLLVRDGYRRRWEKKKEWYEHNFPRRLLITEESGNLSKDASQLISNNFS